MLPIPHAWLLVLDLGGTFVFAVSGAMVAVRHRLDILGVLVLAFVTGHLLGMPLMVTTAVGGVLCFALRYMAIRRGWRLPAAKSPQDLPDGSGKD